MAPRKPPTKRVTEDEKKAADAKAAEAKAAEGDGNGGGTDTETSPKKSLKNTSGNWKTTEAATPANKGKGASPKASEKKTSTPGDWSIALRTMNARQQASSILQLGA